MSADATAASAPWALAQAGPGSFELGDFWSLVQQAGPLRWPIFIVLALGLVQVFIKVYELLADFRASRTLSSADFARSSWEQIHGRVAGQDQSMLASLQAALLNVYETRVSAGMLHDEITNFVTAQRDRFGVFRRRMEFLSDTAGALGLMGTVWGMFTVFFQGTSDQDVILRGMGIALVTTLLGLVVSIILNFGATELSTVFDGRLSLVAAKSDELRFRLLELAAEENGFDAPAAVVAVEDPPRDAAGASRPPEAAPVAARREVGDRPPDADGRWCYLDVNGSQPTAEVGSARELAVLVRSSDGQPAPGVSVLATISEAGGSLNGGGRRTRVETDETGRLRLSYTVPTRAGRFPLDLALPGQPGSETRLEVLVQPGPPHQVEPRGNHQAAVAGMRLPAPLGVTVLDRFANPVPGVPVTFSVREGSGRIGSGEGGHRALTDEAGVAAVPFVVSSQAGQNVVTAEVHGWGEPLELTAFGTEI